MKAACFFGGNLWIKPHFCLYSRCQPGAAVFLQSPALAGSSPVPGDSLPCSMAWQGFGAASWHRHLTSSCTFAWACCCRPEGRGVCVCAVPFGVKLWGSPQRLSCRHSGMWHRTAHVPLVPIPVPPSPRGPCRALFGVLGGTSPGTSSCLPCPVSAFPPRCSHGTGMLGTVVKPVLKCPQLSLLLHPGSGSCRSEG